MFSSAKHSGRAFSFKSTATQIDFIIAARMAQDDPFRLFAIDHQALSIVLAGSVNELELEVSNPGIGETARTMLRD